jgi:POT family proton-dependent oligopeptide transporter
MTLAQAALPLASPPGAARTFFGEPRGLMYLAFTEAWERFSYYGMTALLVLYMVDQLLLPGHVEAILGFATFRAALESATGPLSPQALGSRIFGFYSGFVYFTPVLGGWLADRWIGKRDAVVAGAVLMALGHLAMAFDASFLIALVLLILGSGLIKGNISAQVGALYPRTDGASRARGFTIFSMAINFGAILGPLACGLLAQLYGWHWGFGAAALLMLAGLATYLSGYRHLPEARGRGRVAAAALDGAGRRVVGLLLLVMLVTLFQTVAYFQSMNVALVWAQENVELGLGGFDMPVPWFNAVDPAFSVLGVPVLFLLWRRQEGRGRTSGDMAKIGIGAALAAACNLLLVAASLQQGKAGLIWPLLYYGGLGFAFLWYWPTLLALVSRAAPESVNATMMGVAFITLFIGSNIVGSLGSCYESMSHAAFWGVHAAIAAAGALIVLIAGGPLQRALDAAAAPQPPEGIFE